MPHFNFHKLNICLTITCLWFLVTCKALVILLVLMTNYSHIGLLFLQAWLLWKQNKGLELMDVCLEDSYVEFELLRCIQVGLLCVQKLPEDRPVMSSVVLMLSNEGATLPQPKEPGFFIERGSLDFDSLRDPGKSNTGNTITITTMQAR